MIMLIILTMIMITISVTILVAQAASQCVQGLNQLLTRLDSTHTQDDAAAFTQVRYVLCAVLTVLPGVSGPGFLSV